MEAKYARLMGAGVFAASTFLGSACSTSENPSRQSMPRPENAATATSSLRSNESSANTLLAIRSRIDPLINARSEAEVWQNTQRIAPLIYQAYCVVFPGCVQPAPIVFETSMSGYQDAVQKHDPSGYRPSEDEAKTIYASTFMDRTIVLNRDQQRVRQSLAGGLFSNTVSQMPGVLLVEQAHADVAKTQQIQLEIELDGTKHLFNQFWGFGINSDQTGENFTYFQEAAAILAASRVQQRLGVNVDTPSRSFVGVANYLAGKMRTSGMTTEDMVLLHRESNLDGLLEKLYPQVKDVSQRRILAMQEFTAVYSSTRSQ